MKGVRIVGGHRDFLESERCYGNCVMKLDHEKKNDRGRADWDGWLIRQESIDYSHLDDHEPARAVRVFQILATAPKWPNTLVKAPRETVS